MANIKFSAFTTETDDTQIDFLAGYQGTTMKKIAPNNITGAYPFKIETDSLYSGFVPGSLSGAPQGNTILGIDAGNALTTGTENTLIGNDAGLLLTTQGRTTAVGFGAGKSQAANSNNVYLGREAGRDHTGDQSVFISGTRIFSSGQASNGVVAVGYSAHDTSAGNYSTAIGYQAGNASTGAETTFVGRSTGRVNTAAGSVSMGYQAGYSNTSGSDNTYLGYDAGYTNTTSQNSTYIGSNAGRLATGGSNTMVGVYAGSGLLGGMSGSGNTGVGINVMKKIGSGNNNTGVGSSALSDLGSGANGNIGIGMSAGSGITTGDNYTVVGQYAGNGFTYTGSNITLIGYEAEASSAAATNEITLGDANVTSLRIPGLQSGASDGDVLTFSSGTGNITLQAAGGGGATDLNGLTDCLIDGTSSYLVNIPAGLSGNPANNTILGNDAGESITNGTGNTLLGSYPGRLGNASNNVAIGLEAYRSLDSDKNVAVGAYGGYLATGEGSVFIGYNAGRNSTANSSLHIGLESGYSQTSGTENTNIGYQAAYSNTTSGSNTSVGHQASYYATGQQLAAFGYRALFGSAGVSTGSYNSAFGREAGVAVTSGSQNTLLGAAAGKAITSGANNTVIGSFAAFNSLIDGDNNIVIGKEAAPSATGVDNEITFGDANITALRIPGLQSGASDGDVLTFSSGTGVITLQAAGGGGATSLNGLTDCLVDTASLYVGEVPAGLSGNPQNNTILGYKAGDGLTTGTNNTLIGAESGEVLATGFNNVGVGTNTLETAVGKFANTAVGHGAGQYGNANINTYFGSQCGRGNSGSTVDGFGNVAMGGSAYNNYTTGSGNIAIGYQCLINGVHTGSNNTFVGRDILLNVAFTGSNSMALGYTATPSVASVSNEITLGNSSIATIRAQVTTITALSDERDKTSIEDLPYGLDFVDSLKPRKFVWDHRAETKTEIDEEGNETQVEFYSANKGKKDIGFIAQELQSVDDDFLNLIYDANPEKLEATYGRLVPVLVKAIQDLSAKVTALENA